MITSSGAPRLLEIESLGYQAQHPAMKSQRPNDRPMLKAMFINSLAPSLGHGGRRVTKE